MKKSLKEEKAFPLTARNDLNASFNNSITSQTNINQRQVIIDHEQFKEPVGVLFSELDQTYSRRDMTILDQS